MFRPLFFNIFLCVLFIIIDTTYFASHADDNTPDFIKKTTEVLQELETVLKKLFLWFTENEMMANADKCHLLSSVEDHKIEINGFTVKNSYYEKLSGVQFDDHIKFDFYIEKLCKKANRKLHALARVSIFMDLSKKRMLMSVFFDLQCNHLRLIWLCYSRNKLVIKLAGYMENTYT